MHESSVNEQVKQLLKNFLGSVAQRAAAEQQLRDSGEGGLGDVDSEFQAALQRIEDRFAGERSSAELKHETGRNHVLVEFETEDRTLRAEYDCVSNQAEREYEKSMAIAQREQDDAHWMVASVLDDESEENPKHQLDRLKKQSSATRERLQKNREELEQQCRQTVESLGYSHLWEESDSASAAPRPADQLDALESFDEAQERAREALARLKKQRLNKLCRGGSLAVLFLLLAVVAFAVSFFLVDPVELEFAFARDLTSWALACAGAAIGLALLIVLALLGTARVRSGRLTRKLAHAFAELRGAQQSWLHFAKKELQAQQADYSRRYGAIVEQREAALERIESATSQKLSESRKRKQAILAEADAKYPALLQQIARRRDERLREIDDEFQRAMQELERLRASEFERLKQKYATSNAQRVADETQRRRETAQSWLAAVSRFNTSVAQVERTARRATPPWRQLLEKNWTLPTEINGPVQFGHYEFDLQKLADGLPADRQLQPEDTRYELPAVLPFPHSGSLLLKARGEGRQRAVDAIRNVMLRLLTLLPAGKIRFNIIDPVGLGENFSAFMHLADYDEAMVGKRIWTETPQIEKRLAALTEHMENVFQVYLRNEFESIEDYNRQAGEVAEPYNFLVVANFPAHFSEPAARRLASIAGSGPRCGVYTLISIDLNQPLPHGFDVADLEVNSTVLAWADGRFFNCDPELSWLPLQLDRPPEPETFTGIVRSVGEQSKGMRRVEVPFERIAPRQDRLFSRNSRHGIDVPLGPAGATNLQNLRLGQGTSQHVLVAGKTGSGKSSFLHALITNVALHYSPDEIQFYLIDFKKGVEFKTYATHKLPHARAIGIESDREFGVSVLQRMDELLKERGELFRRHGVQDVASYRKSQPQARLPRILLIIDEFQEFFVEDDQLSQTASLLLDRLVRQGRAFGIHVLLGSQTLGGAYSLARSTLGQVAVRIALQCSETDAHLILSEENTAARLLSRPGEAIYNDANGLVEGNHPFQVAWLSDERRDHYLLQISEQAQREQIQVEPPIVFEGHVASDLRHNAALAELVRTFSTRQPDAAAARQATLRAWLGEAVSIKPPTELAFHRRAGDNLLIVGQESDSVQGLLASLLIELAVQLPPAKEASAPASFYLLDGDRITSEETTFWTRIAGALPHEFDIAGQQKAAAAVAELAAEVQRREAQPAAGLSPVFLFVSNLGRFRELRKGEDDFGFAGIGEEKPPSAAKQLADILRDGPALGVHAIVWCDTCGNLNRWMSMQTLREFEMRIALRMNATDSSNLIDSPAATKLDGHRALLYLSEQGSVEKFRPYGIPSDECLAWISDRLNGGAAALEPADDIESWTVR